MDGIVGDACLNRKRYGATSGVLYREVVVSILFGIVDENPPVVGGEVAATRIVEMDALDGLVEPQGIAAKGLSIDAIISDAATALNDQIIGDDLAFPVRWRGNIGALGGRPVRLRFVLRDADLYSYRFSMGEP